MALSRSEQLVKTAVIEKIRGLIDEVAGVATPWDRLASALRRLSVQELEALRYRIERSLAQAEEFGARSVTEDRP